MKIKHVYRAEARVDRPDLEEYHIPTLVGGHVQLWWDDQEGAEPEGWCVRVNPGERGECDRPVKGRRDSKWDTILRNVAREL